MTDAVATRSHCAALMAVVLSTACWGSTVVLISIAARGLTTLTITVIEVRSATILLGIAVLGRGAALTRPTRTLVLAGLLEPGLAYPLINAGVSKTSGAYAR